MKEAEKRELLVTNMTGRLSQLPNMTTMMKSQQAIVLFFSQTPTIDYSMMSINSRLHELAFKMSLACSEKPEHMAEQGYQTEYPTQSDWILTCCSPY